MDIFDYLAIGAIIEGKIFCIHGGLSPNLPKIEALEKFEKALF